MVSYYLKMLYRNFLKNKFVITIHISCLVLGMIFFIYLIQYILQETGYNKFHSKSDRIYRVIQKQISKIDNSEHDFALAPYALCPESKLYLPEIEEYCRMEFFFNNYIKYNENKIIVEETRGVDSTFFNIFSFPIIKGDPKSILSKPYSLVVTEKIARKLFGNEDPVGKSIQFCISLPYGTMQLFTVTGVIKDIPSNSTIQFDMLIANYNQGLDLKKVDWDGNVESYVLLKQNTNPKNLEKKFSEVLSKFFPSSIVDVYRFYLQPIVDIHFHSKGLIWDSTRFPRGDLSTILLLLFIAILLLITSWINYVNNTISNLVDRSKEFSINKSLGASKKDMIHQLLFETIIINSLSVILTIAILYTLFPLFNNFLGFELSFSLFFKPLFWVIILMYLIVGSLILGFIPSLVISSLKIKTNLKNKKFGSYKFFIGLQFLICFIFLEGIFIIFQQFNFIRKNDLGIDIRNNILVNNPAAFRVTGSILNTQNTFKEALLKHPEIKSITQSDIPGDDYHGVYDISLKKGDPNKLQFSVSYIDSSFTSTYGVKVICGKNSSKIFDEGNSILVNEKGIKALGYSNCLDAIGSVVYFRDIEYKIIGVVRDFHQKFLKEEIKPAIFKTHAYSPHFYFSVKTNSNNYYKTIEIIRSEFQKYFPDYSFDYLISENYYNKQYQKDYEFRKLFEWVLVFSLIILIIGLIAIVANILVRKRKEIAVRKVLGGSIYNILLMLFSEFYLTLFVSIIISILISYSFMEKWLNSFVYKIDLSWDLFLIPFLFIVPVIFITIFIISTKYIFDNPINALKTE